METKLQELQGKLQTLKFILSKSTEVIKRGNIEAITRYEGSIKVKIEASHVLKDEIIELKFGNKETEEQVQEWVAGIEGSLRTFDENLLDLRRVKEKITKENQAVEMSETLKQEMALENEKHEQKWSQERDLYEQQLRC